MQETLKWCKQCSSVGTAQAFIQHSSEALVRWVSVLERLSRICQNMIEYFLEIHEYCILNIQEYTDILGPIGLYKPLFLTLLGLDTYRDI